MRMPEMHSISMEDYEKTRFKNANQAVYKTAMLSIARMITVSPLTEFLGFVCLGIVLYMGGKVVIENQMFFPEPSLRFWQPFFSFACARSKD